MKGIELESRIYIQGPKNGPVVNVGYVYLEGDNRIDAPISRYALDLITHQFNLGIDYQLSEKNNITINYRYVDRLSLDNYAIIDTRLSHRGKSMDIGIFANNLLDKTYTETNLVPMPGRWIGLELGYKIR